MSKVKKQHFVPRFYLSRWVKEASSGQVYVYNKDKKKSYSANVKDISSSNYFYDYPKLNQEQKDIFIEQLKEDKSIPIGEHEKIISFIESQEIEEALGELETINAPIIDNVINRVEAFSALPTKYFSKHQILTSDDILELSFYVALQYARTEEARIMIEHMTQALVKHMSDVNLLNIDNLEKDKELIAHMGEERFKSFADSVKSGKFTKDSYTVEIDEDYTKVNHIHQLFKLTENIADILLNYKWTILVNKTDIPFFRFKVKKWCLKSA